MSVNVGGKEKKRGEDSVDQEEKKIEPSEYSCEIILEKTTFDKSQDKSFPSDAFNITYVVEGERRLDVARSSKMSNVFDLYCDKYGKDSVKKIEYGYGTVNPSQWGYKKPEKKRRRK